MFTMRENKLDALARSSLHLWERRPGSGRVVGVSMPQLRLHHGAQQGSSLLGDSVPQVLDADEG